MFLELANRTYAMYRTLIKFPHLVGIRHTKPYIVVNINPYNIGRRGSRCSIVFFEFLGFWVKACHLCRIIFSEPQLSPAVYCYSPRSAVIRWRRVLPVISPVSGSTLPILLPVSAAYPASPLESAIVPYGDEF